MYPMKMPNPPLPLLKLSTAYAIRPMPTTIEPTPAARSAVPRFLVRAQVAAISIRPPSSGNPGTAFSTAK